MLTADSDTQHQRYIHIGVSLDQDLESALGHADSLFAIFSLSEVRAVCISGMQCPSLYERAARHMPEVEEVTFHSRGAPWRPICNSLRPSSTTGLPFPALRILHLISVELGDLDADEFSKFLSSRPVPIEEMTVVFEGCHNTNESECQKLAKFVTVIETNFSTDERFWSSRASER